MEMQKEKKHVLIIGAGVGGVATAARLSKAGLNVTVLEKNDFTGGRCSLIHKNGHRFDTGPSLLLLPSLFHRAFADLGTSMEAEGVELLKCEPNYRIFFHDSATFTLSSDLPSMYDSITAIEGPEGFNGYLSFLQEAGKHHAISLEHVLSKNFGTWSAMLRPGFLGHVLTLHPFESIWTRVGKHFKTERLRRVFTFASMYMGMSPFEAPGTYSLLQYTECVEGIWYPRGGFHRVVQALVDISQRFGASYKLESPVSQITFGPDNSTVTGVQLTDGKHLPADIVICNADLVYSYNNLLPKTAYAERLSKRPQSCSSVSFYWSLSKKVPELDIHNIFLAEKYRESFDDIFHGVGVPDEPSFYVNVPSRIDDGAAPVGKDSVVVLVPVASLRNGSENSPETNGQPAAESSIDVAALRKHIISTIEARTGASLSDLIVSETINTPESWQETFNLFSGSILGLSHSFFNVLSFRPRVKHDDIKGLYFVGASTHPGTGVPVCLAGSGITASEVLKDLGMADVPSLPTSSKIKIAGDLDRIERDTSLRMGSIALAAVSALGMALAGVKPMVAVLVITIAVSLLVFSGANPSPLSLQKDW